MIMMRLIIARHGETEYNAARRYQGHSDAPLTATGLEQAREIGTRIAPVLEAADVRIISSDLGRALATAAVAAPGRPIETDSRLREMHFGLLEGLTHAECVRRFGEVYRAWIDDPRTTELPGGETFAAFEARVYAWLADQPRAGTAVVFTHGGPAFALIARLSGITFDAARRAGFGHGDTMSFELPAHTERSP
jgi:glucosyl-3-phosphoglycerate phosphatase